MYHEILVPTDGSAVAGVAVDHAVDIAEKYDATVHALYVVDPDWLTYSLGTEQLDRIRQGDFGDLTDLEADAEDATGAVADAARERGLHAIEEVRAGTPHRIITRYADSEDIDLVVMGSHGRSGVKRALLGSVTERVLRSSHLPILVVDEQGVREE
ncbi:universal stress protein [Haloarcula onubensis]|uniref:Universal stress protein n=1 Tax=Haloarcula onubensis TaxID=2950539 RepID=A0ABU2FNA9_9EURY|nr:universal stress protein [Halomicroarcula sp. S3CR25-11]MDS0282254.1 universal stress protein [Halomicroarcula sp. S3CR25-11]